jgi:hypothetical protein
MLLVQAIHYANPYLSSTRATSPEPSKFLPQSRKERRAVGFLVIFTITAAWMIFFTAWGVLVAGIAVGMLMITMFIFSAIHFVRSFRDPLRFVAPELPAAPLQDELRTKHRRMAAVFFLAAILCLTADFALSHGWSVLVILAVAISTFIWGSNAERPQSRDDDASPKPECGQCGITLRPGRVSCHWCGWAPSPATSQIADIDS